MRSLPRTKEAPLHDSQDLQMQASLEPQSDINSLKDPSNFVCMIPSLWLSRCITFPASMNLVIMLPLTLLHLSWGLTMRWSDIALLPPDGLCQLHQAVGTVTRQEGQPPHHPCGQMCFQSLSCPICLHVQAHDCCRLGLPFLLSTPAIWHIHIQMQVACSVMRGKL